MAYRETRNGRTIRRRWVTRFWWRGLFGMLTYWQIGRWAQVQELVRRIEQR